MQTTKTVSKFFFYSPYTALYQSHRHKEIDIFQIEQPKEIVQRPLEKQKSVSDCAWTKEWLQDHNKGGKELTANFDQ